MKTFKIVYDDPETQERKEVIQSFEGCSEVSAKEWAEDYGYMLADKGYYKVEELNGSK